MSDEQPEGSAIRAIDRSTVHRITSGQVVVDLQTAVKELVENSLDAGATNIEIRLKEYGLRSIEVIDNGSGISKENYESIALKHYTSKLSTYEDLTTVRSFGFRGEALSSLCALSDSVTFTTATEAEAPMATILEMERSGKLKHCHGKAARSRGTTATVTRLFSPLPVRRKEWERNAKREFSKALTLLNAYALVPCAQENRGVRLLVYNHPDAGKRTIQFRTDGSPSIRSSVSALWGPKQLDTLVQLDLKLNVQREKASLKRVGDSDSSTDVHVSGLISKFASGSGRTGTDRQFFYVNGRPCSLSKIQKAFNEIYRTFNSNQSPFIIADFRLPTEACDINVSPDKRMIFVHSEDNLIAALKESLEATFSPERSTFAVGQIQVKPSRQQSRNTKAIEVDIGMDVDDDRPVASSSAGNRPEARKEETESRLDSFPLHRGFVSDDTESDGQPHSDPVSATASSDDNVPADRADSRSEEASSASSKESSCQPSTSPASMQRKPLSPNHIEPITPSKPSSSQAPRQLSQLPEATEFTQVLSPVGTRKSYTVAPEKPSEILRPKNKRSVQAILSTAGASWNLQRSSENDDGTDEPRKKSRVDQTLPAPRKLDFKARMSSFARIGGQNMDSVGLNADDGVAGPACDNHLFGESGSDDNADRESSQEATSTAEKEDRKSDSEAEEVMVLEDRVPSTGPECIPIGVNPVPGPSSSKPIHTPSSIQHSSSARPLFPPLSPEATIDLTTDEPGEDVSSEEVHHAANDGSFHPATSITPMSANRGDHSLRVELTRLCHVWKTYRSPSAPPHSSCSGKNIAISAAASSIQNDGSAERELSRVINKADFGAMEVVGQFNKGFIIARLRKGQNRLTNKTPGPRDDSQKTLDDLFLIDQHAADEKYNFEDLQVTTKIQSQQLYRPRPLELNAADEMIARESTDVLRKNGFEIAVKGGDDAESEERERVYLTAQPISKSTVFDMKGRSGRAASSSTERTIWSDGTVFESSGD
ncbi:hypothetical protein FRB98_004589 [Tulasnella sp. 332]|nr:hypothetical protein FRB98_004589 [Tulasnella sp. 332]